MASKALACSAASAVMPNKASLKSASLASAPCSVLFQAPQKATSLAPKRSLVVARAQYGGPEQFGTHPSQYGAADPYANKPTKYGLEQSNQGAVHTPWYTTEDEKAIRMRIDMPGMSPEDLDVKVEGNALVIKDLGRQIFSPYNTTIQLPPDCIKERVEAVLKNGVLHISVPKRFPSNVVHIPVRSTPY